MPSFGACSLASPLPNSPIWHNKPTTLVNERTEQTRFQDLRTASLEHPTAIEWFITNYPELFVEGY